MVKWVYFCLQAKDVAVKINVMRVKMSLKWRSYLVCPVIYCATCIKNITVHKAIQEQLSYIFYMLCLVLQPGKTVYLTKNSVLFFQIKSSHLYNAYQVIDMTGSSVLKKNMDISLKLCKIKGGKRTASNIVSVSSSRVPFGPDHYVPSDSNADFLKSLWA